MRNEIVCLQSAVRIPATSSFFRLFSFSLLEHRFRLRFAINNNSNDWCGARCRWNTYKETLNKFLLIVECVDAREWTIKVVFGRVSYSFIGNFKLPGRRQFRTNFNWSAHQLTICYRRIEFMRGIGTDMKMNAILRQSGCATSQVE